MYYKSAKLQYETLYTLGDLISTGRPKHLNSNNSLRPQKVIDKLMKGNTMKMLWPVSLCLMLILAVPGIAPASDVQVSATIAVGGGIACGVYIVVSYTASLLSGSDPLSFSKPLFSYDRGEWHISFPVLSLKKVGGMNCAPFFELFEFNF